MNEYTALKRNHEVHFLELEKISCQAGACQRDSLSMPDVSVDVDMSIQICGVDGQGL